MNIYQKNVDNMVQRDADQMVPKGGNPTIDLVFNQILERQERRNLG